MASAFDRFCKTAPLPLAVGLIAAFALTCGAIAVEIAAAIPPPAVDASKVRQSVFEEYVREDLGEYAPLSSLAASCDAYRNALDASSQEVYDSVEEGLRNHETKIKMPEGTTTEQAVAVAEAVLLDNPDICWTEGSGLVMSSTSDGVSLLIQYSMDKEEADGILSLCDRCSEDIMSSRRLSLSSADAAAMESIMSSIAFRCSHAGMDGTAECQHISSVFRSGKSVCAGYAKAACYCARKAGIPCVVVQGTGSSFLGANENHAWVAANIDGKVRLYDPYWFDTDVPLLNAWRWSGCSVGDAAFARTHVDSTSALGF